MSVKSRQMQEADRNRRTGTQAFLLVLDGGVRWSGTIGFALSATCTMALAVLGTVDVVGTNLFGAPVPGALELAKVTLAVVVFMGLAYAQQQHAHISVDIITNLAPRSLRRASLLVSLSLGALLFALLAWRTGVLAMESWAYREVASGYVSFPVYPAKAAVSVGCAIAALEFLRQIVWFFIGGFAGDRGGKGAR